MPTVLITGANRGIGLELARQYAAEGWRVHACVREPGKAGALRSISGDLQVHKLDVTSDADIGALKRGLGNEAIDLVINNAGVGGDDESMDPKSWLSVFAVNSIAPMRIAEALLPNLEKSKGRQLVSITSRMGSIADNSSGGSYAYRSSKAALNAAMKSLALDIKGKNITVAVLHPGWVQTDMGGDGAPLAVTASAEGLRRTISGLKPTDSGAFFNYEGKPLPW
jgi:NAD(P)-dependent dehydrogenase (short-subunit alcohol dehydrogenase family)